jgi:hypothetical protein
MHLIRHPIAVEAGSTCEGFVTELIGINGTGGDRWKALKALKRRSDCGKARPEASLRKIPPFVS